MITLSDIRQSSLGLWLVISGTIIAVVGVYFNNIILDHYTAMLIWRWSNWIFVAYFFARWRKWVDGGLSDLFMTGLYLFYAITNEIGLGDI